jgi:hypothetical protein
MLPASAFSISVQKPKHSFTGLGFLFRYKTDSALAVFFQSGNELTKCRTVRHAGKGKHFAKKKKQCL